MMAHNNLTFFYRENLIEDDVRFLSSFSFPKLSASINLDDFLNEVYEFARIKRVVSSLDYGDDRDVHNFFLNLIEKEYQLKSYIDESLDSLSVIHSKHKAVSNLYSLSYFHRISAVINYSSRSTKRLEEEILQSAKHYLSTESKDSNLYFIGDVLTYENKIVTKVVEKIKLKDSPVNGSFSFRNLAIAVLLSSALSFYYGHSVSSNKNTNPSSEVFCTNKVDSLENTANYYTKPISKNKN